METECGAGKGAVKRGKTEVWSVMSDSETVPSATPKAAREPLPPANAPGAPPRSQGSAPALPQQALEIAAGYAFTRPALDLGALIWDGICLPDARIRIPLPMLNRPGLVAGATGTGRTKTLQLIAEQLSAQGVPVFLADVKGDVSGIQGFRSCTTVTHRLWTESRRTRS